MVLGIKANLINSHGGIFEVSVNDKVIYSNKIDNHQEYNRDKVLGIIRETIASNS